MAGYIRDETDAMDARAWVRSLVLVCRQGQSWQYVVKVRWFKAQPARVYVRTAQGWTGCKRGGGVSRRYSRGMGHWLRNPCRRQEAEHSEVVQFLVWRCRCR